MTSIPAFGSWTEQDHMSEKQKRAIDSARKSETTPVSIDRTAQTAVFFGSGRDAYRTSLSACTCSEYVRFGVPCKHIYRLAMELKIIDIPYKTGKSKGERLSMQISFENALSIIESLSPWAKEIAVQMLSQSISGRHRPFLIANPEIVEEFRACPLTDELPVTEKEFPTPSAILRNLSNDDLSDIIVRSGVECPCKDASRWTLVKWILANISNLSDLLSSIALFAYIDNFDMAQSTLIKYFNGTYSPSSC